MTNCVFSRYNSLIVCVCVMFEGFINYITIAIEAKQQR